MSNSSISFFVPFPSLKTWFISNFDALYQEIIPIFIELQQLPGNTIYHIQFLITKVACYKTLKKQKVYINRESDVIANWQKAR